MNLCSRSRWWAEPGGTSPVTGGAGVWLAQLRRPLGPGGQLFSVTAREVGRPLPAGARSRPLSFGPSVTRGRLRVQSLCGAGSPCDLPDRGVTGEPLAPRGWFSGQALEPDHPRGRPCPSVGGVSQAGAPSWWPGWWPFSGVGLACMLSPLSSDPGSRWGQVQTGVTGSHGAALSGVLTAGTPTGPAGAAALPWAPSGTVPFLPVTLGTGHWLPPQHRPPPQG